MSDADKDLLRRLVALDDYPVLTEFPELSTALTDWGAIRDMMAKAAAYESAVFNTRHKTDDTSLNAVFHGMSPAFIDHIRTGHPRIFTKVVPGSVETFRSKGVFCPGLGWVMKYSGIFSAEYIDRDNGSRTPNNNFEHNMIVFNSVNGPRIATGGAMHYHDLSFIKSCTQ